MLLFTYLRNFFLFLDSVVLSKKNSVFALFVCCIFFSNFSVAMIDKNDNNKEYRQKTIIQELTDQQILDFSDDSIEYFLDDDNDEIQETFINNVCKYRKSISDSALDEITKQQNEINNCFKYFCNVLENFLINNEKNILNDYEQKRRLKELKYSYKDFLLKFVEKLKSCNPKDSFLIQLKNSTEIKARPYLSWWDRCKTLRKILLFLVMAGTIYEAFIKTPETRIISHGEKCCVNGFMDYNGNCLSLGTNNAFITKCKNEGFNSCTAINNYFPNQGICCSPAGGMKEYVKDGKCEKECVKSNFSWVAEKNNDSSSLYEAAVNSGFCVKHCKQNEILNKKDECFCSQEHGFITKKETGQCECEKDDQYVKNGECKEECEDNTKFVKKSICAKNNKLLNEKGCKKGQILNCYTSYDIGTKCHSSASGNGICSGECIDDQYKLNNERNMCIHKTTEKPFINSQDEYLD